jgi:hypothetical protein
MVNCYLANLIFFYDIYNQIQYRFSNNFINVGSEGFFDISIYLYIELKYLFFVLLIMVSYYITII